ncbi:LANO_0D02872g1_1 [Lachancea nothofagi CBS 11611]|uniref:Large ribosomal subunit protein uL23m n=1 Tax=Lachancea nothofagi CBS 11611 TaxID=1266666 RepID=A0A1G4JEL0_9SACH|nr:LANO_0D02872g1_1 [Lachancea nothofagi CBS 11611]
MPRLVSKWLGGIPGLFRNDLTSRSLATVATEVSKVEENRSTVRVSDKILNWSREAIAQGKPHFRVGGTQHYFPKARLVLLRPNAKHTPYQAKFIVPKSFNKLDLRDYLFHVYGLRAMNVTTQLLHGKYTRVNQVMPRYRAPQIKKMTIDMAEPFIWPAEPKDKDPWGATLVEDLSKYREEQTRIGSDKYKPGTAFDGALGPYQPGAQPFVPKFLKRRLLNQKNKTKLRESQLQKRLKVDALVQTMSAGRQ